MATYGGGSSSSTAAPSAPDGGAPVAGRRLKSLCPHILPDVELRSETCIRVGRGPPKGGDNLKVVNLNIPQVSKFHFELSVGPPLPGQSVPGWILSNRSRGGTYVGRNIQNCRKVGVSGVSTVADGEVILLFHPNRGPVIGYQFIMGSATAQPQPAQQPVTPKLSGQKRRRDSSSSELPGEEEISEELRCAICQDLMHRPVSVLDCLHNFCSSCLSQWLQRHTDCPQCRSRVRSVKPNRTVINLTEKLIDAEKIRDRRSEQDKKAADDADALLKNDYDLGKVNRQFLLAAHGSAASTGTAGRSDYTDYDYYDSDSEGSSYSIPSPGVFISGSAVRVPRSRLCNFCGVTNPGPGSLCRQNAVHLACSRCQGPVPDRPNLNVRCAICEKVYCTPATYRPCLACSSVPVHSPLLWLEDPSLRKLRDFVTDSSSHLPVIARAFGDNFFEVAAFQEHLQGSAKTIADVTREVLSQDMNAKFEFTIDGARRELCVRDFYNDNTVCSACAYEAAKQCIFTYRKNLPDSQLPQRCRGRDNCW
ncbi:hypothetical protein FOL47_006002 [Perkinsus chesapeaki]|uniref:E3 ubiquitin-protein ligase CHFR n=1 Tax=Perkinsus chesapeaki TaxID=330153 RepID=A0A7J6LUG4_PERCH|nr:hypothetical protein FOL47_006002 [Perkinsus chesapeaki]